MEEIVGSKWHYWVTGKARLDYPEHSVSLRECKDQVALMYRAFGGDAGKRISNSFVRRHKNPRSWIQKLAGTGHGWDLASVNDEYVRLPDSLAIFPETKLNRKLYVWLTALAIFVETPVENIALANQLATLKLLHTYPGFEQIYRELVESLIQFRPTSKSQNQIQFEQRIHNALRHPGSVTSSIDLDDSYPVWMWVYPSSKSNKKNPTHDSQIIKQQHNSSVTEDHRGKSHQAEEVEDPDGRSGLMAFRMESLFSWIEFTPVDRTEDDQSDVDADIADDLDKLTISPGSTSAKRVRMDLDIGTSDQDDRIVEPVQVMLPEWDYRTNELKEDYCCLKNINLIDSPPCNLPDHLKHSARQLKRQFVSLLPQKRWLRNQTEGSEIDIDAWIEYVSDPSRPEQKGLYRQCRQVNRDISCLLLADLSLSTDSWVSDAGRVIDIIRDSVFLFAEALSGCDDRFALCGFSSKKRSSINWHTFKSFEQSYGNQIRGQIAGMEPGFYTRMGAAIRHAETLLNTEQTTHKILLLLTDGKPNDLDRYEGRYGIEDTRHALMEVRQKAVIPYCVTIDQYAREYLPYIFGKGAYTLVQQPTQLPLRLPGLYRQLTQV